MFPFNERSCQPSLTVPTQQGLYKVGHARTRDTLVLDEDMSHVLTCFEAVDEHNTRTLSFEQLKEFLALLDVNIDPTAAFARCSFHGELAPLDDVLYFLFASYPKASVAKEATRFLAPTVGPQSSAEPSDEMATLFRACFRSRGTVCGSACSGDSVGFEDLRRTLFGDSAPSEKDLQALEEAVIRASEEFKRRKERDEKEFRGVRLRQLLVHAGLPADLSTRVRTHPPLSVKNLVVYWEHLHPQLRPHFCHDEMSRLAEMVKIMHYHSPVVALKMSWPSNLALSPSPPNYRLESNYGLFAVPLEPIEASTVRLTSRAFAEVFSLDTAASFHLRAKLSLSRFSSQQQLSVFHHDARSWWQPATERMSHRSDHGKLRRDDFSAADGKTVTASHEVIPSDSSEEEDSSILMSLVPSTQSHSEAQWKSHHAVEENAVPLRSSAKRALADWKPRRYVDEEEREPRIPWKDYSHTLREKKCRMVLGDSVQCAGEDYVVLIPPHGVEGPYPSRTVERAERSTAQYVRTATPTPKE